MTTRNRFIATYYYPGSFVSETATREIDMPTRASAEANKPAGNVGYTSVCYAIKIHEYTDRLFKADNGESKWIPEGEELVDSWIYGEKIHVDDIPDTPDNRILRSNIRINTNDGYAVKHIAHGWDFARNWNRVITL